MGPNPSDVLAVRSVVPVIEEHCLEHESEEPETKKKGFTVNTVHLVAMFFRTA